MFTSPSLRSRSLLSALLLSLGCLSAFSAEKPLTDYVNPFVGTAKWDSVSRSGSTFPGACSPFGMVQLSPETVANPERYSTSGYRYEDAKIYGFSHTHLSGTGGQALFDIMLMPLCRSFERLTKNFNYDSPFSHNNEVARPGYYSVVLDEAGIRAELTTTTRTGMHRYTYPKNRDQILAVDMFHSRDKQIHLTRVLDARLQLVDSVTLVGFRMIHDWQCFRRVCFYAKFNRPVKHTCFMRSMQPWYDNDMINGNNVRCYLQFEPSDQPLIVKVGISPVSMDNARLNLEAENPGWDFDAVAEQARQQWERELSVVTLDGNEDDKAVFYTALYHMLIQPNTMSDVNGDYMRTDYNNDRLPAGETHLSTFSLWDTFRTAHPLYTILKPGRVADMVRSMLRQYDTYGYLPHWQLWGTDNYCMVGNHAVPVVVDAAMKGLAGASDERVYEAVRATMTREHLRAPYKMMDKYGYVPEDLLSQSASLTMELAYDAACAMRLAERLGRKDDAALFLRRSQLYRNLWDPATKFFRGRNADGSFVEPFNPVQYGNNGDNPFTEANGWQCLWFVPHDVDDLIRLLGGKEAFTEKLDTFFTLDEQAGVKNHNASGLIGQYAHGNEPVHHCIYLYDYAGEPRKAQALVDRVLSEQYRSVPAGLTGNEDCGQMSAWYVFSALGFYPTDPCSGRYDLGLPRFDRAVIHLENGHDFTITAARKRATDRYVRDVRLNGERLTRQYVTHDEIMKGGTLVFQMGK